MQQSPIAMKPRRRRRQVAGNVFVSFGLLLLLTPIHRWAPIVSRPSNRRDCGLAFRSDCLSAEARAFGKRSRVARRISHLSQSRKATEARRRQALSVPWLNRDGQWVGRQSQRQQSSATGSGSESAAVARWVVAGTNHGPRASTTTNRGRRPGLSE